MDHATAKAIAAEVAPSLLVDDQHPKLTDMFVVRKVEGGHPFSIHLASADPANYPPIEAKDAVAAVDAVAPTADHPGSPAVPARPAVLARTSEGQAAEIEQKAFKDSLAAAIKMLG